MKIVNDDCHILYNSKIGIKSFLSSPITMDDISFESVLKQLLDYVQLGTEWGSEKLKSACPFKRGKPRKGCYPEKTDEDIDTGPSCTEQRSYTLPSQRVSYCYIKMQDPYAPPCCEPQLPPCLPKGYRQKPREPTCGCDLCKKNVDSKCCSPNAAFRSAGTDSKYYNA